MMKMYEKGTKYMWSQEKNYSYVCIIEVSEREKRERENEAENSRNDMKWLIQGVL